MCAREIPGAISTAVSGSNPCSMPPPDAGVYMPDEERIAILTWLLCGDPE